MTTFNELYDRQYRTYGIDATNLIQSSCVYLYGLKNGYAGEICKNLALSGIKKIIFIGNDIIDDNDKLNCMFYRKSSIGSYCWEEISKYINEINCNVIIEHINNINEINNNTIIIINKSLDEIKQLNINNKMVYMLSGGLAGSIFVNAGNNHIVYDTTGEQKDTVTIKDIINNKIICDKHNFTFGDKVKLINLNGDNLDYYNNIFNVVESNNYSINILKENNEWDVQNNINFINESLEYIPTKTIFNHNNINIINISDVFKNLNSMIVDNKCDIKEINASFKYTFAPIVSVMGGLVSNEVIKLITNKYTPISQFYDWTDFDIIKDYNNVDNEIKEIYNKFNNSNILMVGCGALGCEWLKNLAIMGNPSITIVDPDHIERSNLSRQFLFRNHHIGKSKCMMAIESINNMIISDNINNNMIGYNKKLTSEDIEGTNKLFNNKTIIISALDNIEARKYVDSVCFNRCLPLFESGTMGMKCNTLPIIPYITETYSDSSDNSEDVQFPVCTIKNFPNNIQHTIHWARDYFDNFNRGPINCNNYINNNHLDKLPLFEKNQAIDDINYFLTDVPKDINDCLIKAKKLYEELFIFNIKQLLHTFPSNHTINGEVFWSHGKLCPKELDFNNDVCVDFIKSTTFLFCQIYNINIIDIDIDIKSFKVSNYEIKDIKIAKNDEEAKELTKDTTENKLNINIEKKQLINLEFEKDDNYHINWINSASNCRATNYGINTISKYETKGIAGKIIPAIATTTSTAVGLIAIEMLKYLNNIDDIEKYRSWYLNMADNTIVYSEPMSHNPIIVCGKKLNGWTKFNYNKNTTLEEFIKYYEDIFKVPISMILYGSAIIYADFINHNLKSLLFELFNDEFDININENNIELTIMSDDTTLPLINIKID